MKLETLITKCVRANPYLYASTSWEVLRWRVLDHLYIHTQTGFRWSKGRLISMFPNPELDAAPARPPLPRDPVGLMNFLPVAAIASVKQTALYLGPGPRPVAGSGYTPTPLSIMSPLMHIPDDVEPDYYRGASELCVVLERYLSSHGCLPAQRLLLNHVYENNGWEP